ncbi:thioesterase family protein [Enterovibrio sp. ZSDZ35]|uniref:Thioesterase family protein n=1 Tax=Enterovibrio qingdaonensis TaxID=2899818 RepID=A0ABT5QTG0_9GAMM|nr:thioesterase family protein [Enterovibrio sp. ZSDZ35]MDD1784266.1 thioesterase family protein [Enterovibrio sp. ZSDZ35]
MPNLSAEARQPHQTGMITLLESPVLPEWIDYNGHMNDAYYVVAFSQAIDAFMLHIGLDETFREEHSVSIYTLQSMVTYLKEVAEAEPIVIRGQLLESDSKKLRLFLTMYHADNHDELATMETLLLHMDMKARRAAPFLAQTQALVNEIQTAHSVLEIPRNAGRGIVIKRVG